MSVIKPSDIFGVLDLTRKIRTNGGKFVPCFAGHAGIGKSEICQAWAKKQGNDFGFIDIRLAYMEGPDMVGMPQSVCIDGKYTTIHSLPEFLPTSGSGLILFEEPNRAHESVMQTMMQILTDRKIHNYTLPEGWVIASAINPEGSYSVNSMDAALKNRFSLFDVNYHHNSFVDYIKEVGYNSQLVAFVESGLWVYKDAAEVGTEGHYISPRSFSKLNDVMKVLDSNSPLFFEMAASVLGKVTAADLNKFLNEIKPILWEDFAKDRKGAMDRFKKLQKSGKDYKGDLNTTTVNSIKDAFKANAAGCDEDFIMEVAKLIDLDQATDLLLGTLATKPKDYIEGEFVKKNKKFFEYMKRRREGKNDDKAA